MAKLEPIPTWALSLDDDRARAAIFDWLQRLNNSVESSLNLQNEAGCIFEYSSATVCKLNPYRSGKVPVYIDGKLSFIDVPAAGISFSNSGLSASTLYYAYVYWTGTTLGTEFSTTGHTDSNGVETKSNDQTRTLVGMVFASGTSTFRDEITIRNVRTWYNDPGVYGFKEFASIYSTTSASFVELSTAERVFFIAWDGELIVGSHQASVYNSTTTGGNLFSALSLSGGTSDISQGVVTPTATSSNLQIATSRTFTVTEGVQSYFTVLGATSSGTANWQTSHTGISYFTRGR